MTVATMQLTLDTRWLEAGFVPESLDSSPFAELPNRPRFHDIADAELDETTTSLTLATFGKHLAHALAGQLDGLTGPVHLLMSGGYDSRALAYLLETAGVEPLYVTDGTQEPSCSRTLDYLGVPSSRRYVHDLSQPDPYRLVDARVRGWAPLYAALTFAPTDPAATLVTGLGGGEWFSYPAARWHAGKTPRIPHAGLRSLWLDCWPQYAILPDAWAAGYKAAIHPYCTVDYATVAVRARPEWLHENTRRPALDAVREALLDALDPGLKTLGWEPHRYDWRLGPVERDLIDERARESWLWREFATDEWGRPSLMDWNDHACTMAGFSRWCDELIADGAVIR